MSTAAKFIPREKRLRIVAIHDHKTIHYEGNIYEFIEQLIREKCCGEGSFVMNFGDAQKLTFDFREKVSAQTD